MAFQASVVGYMRQGFHQIAAERMTTCLPVQADPILANPLIALPFLESNADAVPAVISSFELNPWLKPSLRLLRYLEAQSLAGNTIVEVRSICEGDELGGAGGLDDVLQGVRECERQGWVVETEGLVQLRSNYYLQSAVRDHLARICDPFHPVYSQRELEHAFSRLDAFTPDLFAHDMLDEVSLAINARLVLVRYEDIKAASEFIQQYSAVSELLTNAVPTLVSAASAKCVAYEDELGVSHVPFYEITDGAHGPAVVVQQFNQLPLFEIFQLLAGLENVVNLVALVDTTLPANAAVEQMSRYFTTVDVRVRRQGALPIQQCFREFSAIEARIDAEDVQRIAVVCDCPAISLMLNRRYSSVPGETKVPKKGDLIRLSPRGLRRQDDALIRIVNVKPSELFVLQSQMYRTIKAEEFARHSWAAGFALDPREAGGMALPPVLVFTSAQRGSGEHGSGGEMKGMALVRNLQAQGVRVIEHCLYEIEGFPRVAGAGTLQRIVPLVE
ncbi:hypothetical protein, partial [Pseudomonas viridiflava]